MRDATAEYMQAKAYAKKNYMQSILDRYRKPVSQLGFFCRTLKEKRPCFKLRFLTFGNNNKLYTIYFHDPVPPHHVNPVDCKILGTPMHRTQPNRRHLHRNWVILWTDWTHKNPRQTSRWQSFIRLRAISNSSKLLSSSSRLSPIHQTPVHLSTQYASHMQSPAARRAANRTHMQKVIRLRRFFSM